MRITYRRAGMLDHVEADAVICAIPYSVLRHIAVTPEWTPEKRKVIDGMYYGPVVRATYQVSRRYWEDEGLNGFGSSDKNFEVWHPTYGKPGRRGLLQAYIYEDYAHQRGPTERSRLEQARDPGQDEVHPAYGSIWRRWSEVVGQRSVAKGRIHRVSTRPTRVVSGDMQT